MPRFKLTLEYDGGPFVGWQRQDNGMSVQQAVEDAVFAMTGERVSAHGAGRTDAGVHATGQVAHVDLSRDWTPFRLGEGLNARLVPHPVAVVKVERAAEDFDARHSARARHYVYRIVNRRAPLTLERGRAWRDQAAARRRGDAGGRPRADRPARLHHFSRRAVPGEIAGSHAGPARRPPRRRRHHVRGQRAVVPAPSGALDGRLAGRRRLGALERSRPQVGAGRSRPQPLRPGRAAARPLSGAGGLRTGRREIALEHALVDARQRLEILERDPLVDGMHGRVDEAEFDHRADVLDEARVGGAPAGRELRAPPRHVRDGVGDEVGERPALGQKRDRIGGIEGQREAPAPRRRLDAPLDLGRERLRRPASLKRMLKTSRTSPGMTFAAGLPTSTLTTSRFDGSKSGPPASSGGAMQGGENRGERANRIVGEMRIGDMALPPVQREAPGQRSAPSVLDRVAERRDCWSARRRCNDRTVRPSPAPSRSA